MLHMPKKTDLKEFGFDSQEKAKLMVSHINSQPKENLKGKSPLEMMEFLSADLYKKIHRIWNQKNRK